MGRYRANAWSRNKRTRNFCLVEHEEGIADVGVQRPVMGMGHQEEAGGYRSEALP